ncbi:MAG: hypothetical protein AAGA64_00195 [Bacteroidota bacterium]
MDKLHPIQIERFRKMTFAEKWKISTGMLNMARKARYEAAKLKHPGATEKELWEIVAKEFACART